MFTIGITGGSGAGKTSALCALASLGALALDCDAIYHELLASDTELKSELETRFNGVLRGDAVDRKRLGEIVFSDPSALRDLNAITHKYIGKELASRVAEWESRGGKIVAVDAIALIESGRAERCDVVIGVTAPRELRISRIMARDGITREQAEMRIDAQKPDSFFKESCDYLLEGVYNGSEEFEESCKKFFKKIIGGYEDA
jgi:dephospho-CoA kinase